MEIHVISVGEWMNTLQSLMMNAADGDCFCLPTDMHFHAYMLVKEAVFPEREFKVEIKQQTEA
jgi:hypothetical protein